MAKTYIDTVKYMIYAHVEIDGIVEQPDVVGALFGQTEGLLGEDLDLRELQKSGRIGRIEVALETKTGKSVGTITVPSSLDKVETSLLAAALESVDRVGPCEAKINIEKIEDTRSDKRGALVDRAKLLLQSMAGGDVPETREISERVRAEVKTAEVQEYGADKLAAGPDVDMSSHIIVVEGRADVLNLLKCDIKNVICLQGKKIPKTVIALAKEKEITAFVDGDRGGDLIITQLADEAKIDHVAKAPDGKEVEELTKKEVLQCLKRGVSYDQYIGRPVRRTTGRPSARPRAPAYSREGRGSYERRPYQRRERREYRKYDEPKEKPVKGPEEEAFESTLKGLEGTLKGVILDSDSKVLAEVNVRDIAKEIENHDNIHAVIFDGIITQRIVNIATEKNINYIVGIKQGRIRNTGRVKVLTIE